MIWGFCEWKPLKNTERQAIKNHGKTWKILDMNPNGRVLIESLDKKDMRWINENQITKEK